jgi:hypothetical protein
MFSTPQHATVIACIALAALTGALVASPVAAMPDTQTPPNATTTTTTPDDDTRNVSIQVDDQTYVAGYEYRNGEFRVTLTTSAAVRRVTISEAIGGDTEGAGYFAVRQVTLTRGKPTTVTVPAEQIDGKAIVSLTTRSCIQAGKCPYIQAGSGSGQIFNGSATWTKVWGVFIVGSIGTTLMTRRWQRYRDDDDDDVIVERVGEGRIKEESRD